MLLLLVICFAVGKNNDTSPVNNFELNAVQDGIMTTDSNEAPVIVETPSPEYDTLQRMFLNITEGISPADIEQFIEETGLCYTIGEYNQSSPGKSIVYRIAFEEGVAKQKYADSGDYLDVAFDGGQNDALQYAHYVNVDNIGYTALLYNYGTWYDFRCDQPGEYSGYYINNSFGKDKGITITYNNGNTVKTNYFKYDSAETVINKVIASLEEK